MKSALEIFVLTKREQRAIILIMITLLAATIANHYRDEKRQVPPTPSRSVEPSVTPISSSAEDEEAEQK